MSIGQNIKCRRKALEMTLEDVAKQVGITRQTLSRYETGIIGNIPSDKIEALALTLRTTPAYLMGWEGYPESNKKEPNLPTPRITEVVSSDDISPEAKEIAKAFDKATPKEQNLVRLTLSEYLDDEEYQYAAARGNSAVKIPLQTGLDDFPENDTNVDG